MNDILIFTDPQGQLRSVKGLSPDKAHQYVDALPCCFNAHSCIEAAYPDGAGIPMSEKEFKNFLKTVKENY